MKVNASRPSRRKQKWAKGCIDFGHRIGLRLILFAYQSPSRQRKRPIGHPGRITIVQDTGCVDWHVLYGLFQETDGGNPRHAGINRPKKPKKFFGGVVAEWGQYTTTWVGLFSHL